MALCQHRHCRVYFFSQALNEAEAREEAQRALTLLNDQELMLPVFMDYESGEDRRMELTIRISPDQKSYQFVSWLPAESQNI